MYSKHDATKAGYKRELKSNLSYDELVLVFKKRRVSRIDYDIESYIYDLVNSLCVLYKDGLNYKFAHRSFQEYFEAVFLKELSDENQ